MYRTRTQFAAILVIFLTIAGCAGTRSFTTAARAGDTISLAVGWNKNITRQNMTVTITPSSGPAVTYAPGDPRVRGIVNLYPDPVSKLIVGTETAQALAVNANVHGNSINSNITNQDKDWGETTVFIDLPSTLGTGTASIALTGPMGAVTPSPITVDILPGTGSSNPLSGQPVNSLSGSMTAEQFATLERADTYTITFSGPTVPYAIHLQLNRTAAVGTPWVINPRGDIKNLAWSDTGTKLQIILTPAKATLLSQMIHFKFYIAGGVDGLTLASLKAYDINGNSVSGVTHNILH